jgi:hypothetical protein
MLHCGYNDFAEALVFVHGKMAAAEAARHAILCEKSGDTDFADTWRKVQSAVADIEARRTRPVPKAA